MVDREPKREQKVKIGQLSRTPPMPKSNDAFSEFDPKYDVQAGQFTTMSIWFERIQSGVVLFVR